MYYSFEDVKRKNVNISSIGKKAESLIQMSEWKFPIPDGGCITTKGLDKFIKLNKLDHLVNDIKKLLKNYTQDKQIEKMAKEVRELILQGEIPSAIKEEIKKLQKQNPRSHFAVRSSGTKEDLHGASFAGQYTSILNVKTLEHLELAVKQCWASLFNTRVLNYCINKRIDFSNMGLAVILQKMIPAEKSGVIFTVNPLQGFDKEIFIEACFGIGEALVSGEVNPDQYIYNWYEEKETDRTIAEKKISIIALEKPPFIKSIDNTPQKQTEAVLNKKEVKELSELALKIQSKYGFPVDIEWAKFKGKFYILQSRPITTINFRGIEGEWSTADFKDGGVSSTVCSPYMWSLYDLVLETSFPEYFKKVKLLKNGKSITWGDMYYGRPYFNASAVKQGLKGLPGFVERDFDENIGIEVTYDGPGHVTKTNLKTLWTGIKVLSALGKSFKEQMAFCSAFKENQLKKLYDLETFNYSELTREEYFKFFEKFIREEFFLSETSYFMQIYNNSNYNSLFKDKFKKYKDKFSLLNLMSGLTDLSHLIPNYKIWDLKEKIKCSVSAHNFWKKTPVPELVELWRSSSIENFMGDVREYINEFKFHSTRELDITVPRYGEDPTFVMETIKNSLDLDEKLEPRQLSKKQYKAFLIEKEKFLKAIPFYKRKGMDKTINKLRDFMWWREELRDLSTQYYYWVRKFTLVLAGHFLEMGILNKKEDIFFLNLENIFDVIHNKVSHDKTREIIRLNRTYYNSFRNYQNPNEIGTRYSQSENSNGKYEEIGNVLTGIGSSPGVVTGKVKVIKDIFDADRIEKGDILITKFTDPGWTPKFSLLSAVATETGGLLSHAAVISREYGIPAVLAINNLTNILQDGQEVTIDGSEGKVVINGI